MRNRIDILKDIMQIEKKYALEDIDSEIFEKKMQKLEKELKNAPNPTEDEIRKASSNKEVPLSAHQLIGVISIEELLPAFEVPRTFFRHLKIKRESKELEKNIKDIKNALQKIKLLQAEKKINQQTANLKIEHLEFDLRLAENRLGARQKYMKRNPTKAELLLFTLKNFRKFSYGHGVKDDQELHNLIQDMEKEIEIRRKYRDALADMLATLKASQLEISSRSKNKKLPNFKKMRQVQNTINEVQDYLKILSNEIKKYSTCLASLEDTNLAIDEENELAAATKFGIDVLYEPNGEKDDTVLISEDPLLQTLEMDQPLEEMKLDNAASMKAVSDLDSLKVPDETFPLYEPDLDIEIIGKEGHIPYNIDPTASELSKSTEQIIFQSFENMLSQLLEKDEDIEEISEATQKKKQIISQKPVKKAQFTKLSEDLDIIKKQHKKTSSEHLQTENNAIDSIEPNIIEDISKEKQEEKPQALKQEKSLPSIPSQPTNLQKESVPEKMKSESIDATTKSEIITPRKIEPQITPSKVAESKPEEVTTISEQHKPSKEFMITSELVETATEAWKQVGKPLFNYVNGEREFQGYLQEVIVFEKNRLGYSIVSEIDVSQDVIDKIFHQIKPLWITEEYIESAKKRREFVIQEVQESLRIPKDVALHISKLQEFTNFRNIDFPLANCTINAPEMIGVIPLEKIRIKRGNPACKIEDILEPESYRTAPWADNFSKFEYNPIGKTCYHNYGMKIGKILAVVYHPLLGKVLLIGKDEPNKSLINYLVQRLNLQNEDIDDRKWLVKYLIAKQLNIPEGEALTPKTLIDYSLRRGFPILPNEILNSFRIFASAGSLEKINKKEVIFRNSTRLFHPSEIFPLKCLRIRNLNGKHIGTCIGISLSDKPVLLISEKLSRDVVKLFSSKKVEREIMNDISESVIGTLGVDVKDSLCTHNILKTLIVTKKIQTLEEYGKILSKLSVTGISLSQIAIVEKGTVYIKDSITQKSSTGNIFDQT